MNAREKILSIRLAEKISRHREFARDLGLEVISYGSRKKRMSEKKMPGKGI